MVRSLRAGHPLNSAFQVIAREMRDPLGSEMGIRGRSSMATTI